VDVSLTSQNQQPIEITSVFGPVGPVNWGGPMVEITLKNVGVEPVISLTATLEIDTPFNISFDFTFNVTPSNPLQPNKSTSSTLTLIGGGFSSNVSYPLKIHATLQNGAKFVYTKLVQIVEPPVVTFPDPNLEAAIRLALHKTFEPIYASELAGLASLSADYRGIEDLSGLQYCTNLTYLDLGSNQISDISPLANLTNLTYLGLGSNQISDISPLANLTNLTDLNLAHNQISDISPLASLTNLIYVELGWNQISDISLLANLTNLTDLALESNQISDISPLANLTNLTYLNLGGNQISDISPLANFTDLIYLYLDSNQISDISSLANLTNLTYLGLGSNQISDISPLANLTNLTYLGLGSNQISDVSPLANLTNLTDIDLRDNQISDIGPLIQNEGLGTEDSVYLSGNPLSSDSINIYIPQLRTRGVTVDY